MAPSPKKPLEELYQRPGFLIRRAQQIAVSLFLEETGELGITNTQYGILMVLKDRPGIDQACAGAARAAGEFARVIGVQHHIARLAAHLERAHEFGCDAGWIGDRNTGVHADNLDMRDCGQPLHHVAQPPRRQDQWVAAGEDDFPDVRVGTHIVKRRIERRAR